jgi:hypothetical protein
VTRRSTTRGQANPRTIWTFARLQTSAARAEDAVAPSIPAPRDPQAPYGTGALLPASGSGFFFGFFALFLALLALAAPRVCRWLRLIREVLRPPPAPSLLERPG